MKRILIIPVIGLFFLLTLTGCGQVQVESHDGGDNSDFQNSPSGNRLRQPDFGQPESDPDIRGIVKSVVGNEVSILTISLGGERQKNDMNSKEENQLVDSERSAPSLSGAALEGGEMRVGSGMMPQREGGQFGGPGGGTDSSRAEMLEKIKEMSTGEDKIIIPVGIRMLKFDSSSDNKQREAIEAVLSDVSADKTITVWLNHDIKDKKVAEFVLIN